MVQTAGRYGARSQAYEQQPEPKRGMSNIMGIVVACFVLLASAGGTVYFLTKPAENQLLVQQGQRQLQLGQYAFALKTLSQAVKLKPDDPKALLSLARAYVGVDQIDKAWECITRAQQLGAGVVAEPQLASELATYYRQHGQNAKAVELLRPLAASNLPGKKAELSDLDAAWGDQALQEGDLKQAMRCWEEVKETGEGLRVGEADSRLATIYTKAAEELLSKGQDDEALKYYVKLDTMAPTAVSYQRTAEIYEKQGKLELAIDQLRKAVQVAPEPAIVKQKLATVMAKRGKELLDNGDANSGYAYLQQAQELDPKVATPVCAIRSVRIGLEEGMPHLTADVWNPGPTAANAVIIKAELFDNGSGRLLWSKEYHVIDEFVPPLAAKDSRPLDILSAAPVSDPSSSEMRLYINGSLYSSYPLAKATAYGAAGDQGKLPAPLRPKLAPSVSDGLPPVARDRVRERDGLPPVAPDTSQRTNPDATSPEEKTLKDLE